jgi:hypothetical protein
MMRKRDVLETAAAADPWWWTIYENAAQSAPAGRQEYRRRRNRFAWLIAPMTAPDQMANFAFVRRQLMSSR